MATVSAEILAKQEAYAARPFAVGWSTSHSWICCRFETFADAMAYMDQQWDHIRDRVKTDRYYASNLRKCYVETPTGKIPARYYILCDDVSSY